MIMMIIIISTTIIILIMKDYPNIPTNSFSISNKEFSKVKLIS